MQAVLAMYFYAADARAGHSVLDLTGPDGYPFQNSPYGDPFRSLPENCGDSMAGWQKTCDRTCAARVRTNRMGRIRQNVQGAESHFYRTLNAKTP